jgi:hypothetical protein
MNGVGLVKRLAVVDLTTAPPAQILTSLERDFDLVLLLLPVEGLTGGKGRARVVQISDIERFKKSVLVDLKGLFACGANNSGPQAEGAACSFAAAADYSLYTNSRFAHVLLSDLGRLVELSELTSIELFSDKNRGGMARLPLSCLAKILGISLSVHSLKEHRFGARELFRRLLPDPTQPWWQTLRERIRLTGINKKNIALQAPIEGTAGARMAMLVYHPKSVRHLVPVLEELTQAGNAVDFFSPRPEVTDFLRTANCASYPLTGPLPTRHLARQVEQFIQRLEIGSTAESSNERSLQACFKLALVRLAFAELIVYTRCARPLAEAFRQGGHKLAVGTDSGSTAGRCFFLTAEQMGIPTAFLQHGSFSVSPNNAPYFTRAHIYTWGDTSRQQLIDSGVSDPERITPIGSAFEESHLNSLNRKKRDGRPLILVAFGVPGNLVPERPFLAACREVVAAAAIHSSCDFVVKPHPGDKTSVWQGALNERALSNIKLSSEDTYQLLGQSALLITMFSTTGAEAIYLDRPVISVNLENFPATNDYFRHGAAYNATEPGSLARLLTEILTVAGKPDRLTAARKEFANKLLHREAVPARQRIAAALEGLALAGKGSGCSC